MFGKFEPELSEIFLEGVFCFLNKNGHLLNVNVNLSFFHNRSDLHTRAVEQRSSTLSLFADFVDGKIIRVARTISSDMQKSIYNGNKRTHAFKFQTVVLPDGLVVHEDVAHEGRRHSYPICTRSKLDEHLRNILKIGSTQYRLYGDSAYCSQP